MKKMAAVILAALLLSGCSARETFETLGNVWEQEGQVSCKELLFDLPADASTAVFSESGGIWFCDGYEITKETLSGGDIGRSVQQITGYSMDSLTCIETASGQVQRLECAWTAAGEDGDQVCRAVILDDGVYHYVLTVMAPAEEAGSVQEAWQAIFASVRLQG